MSSSRWRRSSPNVIGSANVVDAARRHGVPRVVCLSTDKAVMPVSAMGLTKALMEKVAHASVRAAESSTAVSVVRYGNVLYSRGSVVPLFVNQIAEGQDLSLTDPAMTRFLMPLSEALELVHRAFAQGCPGDTFIRKSPAATMGDVATAVNELFGNRVGIREIGVRLGEKRFETLATAAEVSRADDLGDHFRVPMDTREARLRRVLLRGRPRTRRPRGLPLRQRFSARSCPGA